MLLDSGSCAAYHITRRAYTGGQVEVDDFGRCSAAFPRSCSLSSLILQRANLRRSQLATALVGYRVQQYRSRIQGTTTSLQTVHEDENVVGRGGKSCICPATHANFEWCPLCNVGAGQASDRKSSKKWTLLDERSGAGIHPSTCRCTL